MEIWEDNTKTNLVESVTTWVHIGADYLKWASFEIEPLKDLDSVTFYTASFTTHEH